MINYVNKLLGTDRIRERATRLSDDANTLLFASDHGADTSHAMHCYNGIRLERRSPDALEVLTTTIDDGALVLAMRFIVDATGRHRGRGQYNAFGAGMRTFPEGSEQALIDQLLNELVDVPDDYWDRRE